MSPLDWLLSLVGLAGFVVFVGTIASFVPEPDLLIVVGVAVLLAVYDFWIRPLRQKRTGEQSGAARKAE